MKRPGSSPYLLQSIVAIKTKMLGKTLDLEAVRVEMTAFLE